MRTKTVAKWLLALTFPCLAAAPIPAPEHRFPVMQDPQKGWGFIDQAGTLVIPYQFPAVHNFHDNLAPVLVGGLNGKTAKWAYIDPTGKIIIQPQFVDAAPFSEGLAAVRIHSENSPIKDPWGYIDTTGKLVIPPQYAFAAPFSNARARVNFDNKIIFIDTTGNPIPFPEGIKKAYDDFHEDLAPVGDNRTPAIGYIDPAGKLAIPLQPGLGAPFSEGLAAALISTGKFPNVTKTLNFIDPTGKTVLTTNFSPNSTLEDPIHFSEGLCRIVHFNRKSSATPRYLYLDKTGKIAIELTIPNLRETYDFHEGLARIKVGGDPNTGLNGKFGYIDKSGKILITPQYPAAEDFQNSLAQVLTEDSTLTYINPSGTPIYPPNSTAKDH